MPWFLYSSLYVSRRRRDITHVDVQKSLREGPSICIRFKPAVGRRRRIPVEFQICNTTTLKNPHNYTAIIFINNLISYMIRTNMWLYSALLKKHVLVNVKIGN